MKSKSAFLNILIIILALSPLAYLYIVWKNIPEIIPIHYDLNFKPDRMDNKSALLIQSVIMSAISIFIYFLLLNIRKIDPKQRAGNPSSTFKKIAIVIVVFITALNFIILSTIWQHIQLLPRLILPLLGLLFAFIGNYMNNIKPNYFAGLRLPWTLSSDYNWRKTHHLAGKLWFWGGLICAVLSLLFPIKYSLIIFFTILVIVIIIPIIYSYRIFKQENSKI